MYVHTDDSESSSKFQLIEFLFMDTKKHKVFFGSFFSSKMLRILKVIIVAGPHSINGIGTNVDTFTMNP